MSVPLWLLNTSSKTVILKSILTDINGMEYYNEIFQILSEFSFSSRINYNTKVALVIFLSLRSKSIPILIEDVMIYSNVNKMAFLSLLVKNKNLVSNPYPSIDYVVNVFNRIYETFKTRIKLSYASIKSKVELLYNTNYYLTKSPLTSILILCFYDSIDVINSIVKENYPTTTTYTINKEISRVSKILKEEPTESLIENCSINKKKKNKEAIPTKILKKKEKEKKIDRAIRLYRENSSTDNHTTDYEGLLIEGMVKKGYTKEMIMNLTKKGMEYYNEYE